MAAAQAQLELARRSGEVGSIALAHLNLGAVLAALGDHQSAIAEYESLLRYIELAAGDDERETQRRLRMLSPSAPPPGSADIDLDTVSTVARITLAESLVTLGRRAEARTQLDRAAPGTKGFGRGTMRKRLAEVRRRLDAAADPTAGSTADQPTRRESDGPPAVGPADESLPQTNFWGRVSSMMPPASPWVPSAGAATRIGICAPRLDRSWGWPWTAWGRRPIRSRSCVTVTPTTW